MQRVVVGKRLALCLLVVEVLSGTPRLGAAANDRYVLVADPPSVAVVDIGERKTLASVPLKGAPTYAIVGVEAKTLFVLSHVLPLKGERGDGSSEITVIDTSARRVLKSVPINTRVTKMLKSGDGRSVVCVSEGVDPKKRGESPGAAITVLDAQTGETLGAVTLQRRVFQLLVTSDLSSLFVLSPTFVKNTKKLPHEVVDQAELSVFHTPRLTSGPTAKIPGEPFAMALSSDEKWVYVLDRGYHNHFQPPHFGGMWQGGPSVKKDNTNNHRDGVLHVFDATTAAQAASLGLGTSPWKMLMDATTNSFAVLGFTEDGNHGRLYDIRGKDLAGSIVLGEFPQQLMRVAGFEGRFVVAYDEIRFLPDEGGSGAFTIPINASKTAAAGAKPPHEIDGWPGEVHFVPDARRFVVAVEQMGYVPPSRTYPYGLAQLPKDSIAVLDIEKKDVTQVVKAGRGGVRVGKAIGSFAVSMGIAMATAGVGYGMGSPYVVSVFPTDPLHTRAVAGNERIVVSRDGSHAYVLNTPTNDVTIVRISDGNVVDRLAVGGGCHVLSMSPGGRFVYAHTSDDITLIDTTTNQVHLKHHIQDGEISYIIRDEERQLLLAMTTKALVVLDAKEGRVLGEVQGVSRPVWLALPDEAQR